jgi:hypothetical protein
MTELSYGEMALRITTRRHGAGWTFVVEIRDHAGTLVKTLASEEVVFLSAALAEQGAAHVAQEWVDDVWTWHRTYGSRPRNTQPS